MSSPLIGPPVAKAKALSCPNCGGAVEIRGFAHTLSVVCPSCLSVLDATTPEFVILQKFHGKQRFDPKIPLGSRGKIGDIVYEVIGFQVRESGSDEDAFSWDEYLLFNPYKGFRYLSEFQGHWNFIRTLSALPIETRSGIKPAVHMLGRTYVGFDSMLAKTSFILGEFPWQARVGDVVKVDDYVSPPQMLSSEKTENEVTWSLGEYVAGSQLWQSFRLPGSAPSATGVFANQQSPFAGKVRSSWRTWLLLNIVLLAAAIMLGAFSASRNVFQQDYTFSSFAKSEPSFVTPPFELTGRTSNIELYIRTDLLNSWAYFNFALINEESGHAFDFGREISYYTEGGETEGKPVDTVTIPSVPSGRYYLRVEPEMDPKGTRMTYRLAVRRDVPHYTFFWIAALLLLIPPILTSIRAASFEASRWRESDYAPVTSGGD
jgi:hypothetical protein